jgi:lipoyl-dependent peroxiredoxin
MPVRKANAEWRGDLKSGKGTVALGSGAWEGPYSFASRFEDGSGSNPEELIAAAHAGCFSMALSNMLAGAGHTPVSVRTKANVHLQLGDGGPKIDRIDLECDAEVPGISVEDFQTHAQSAKENCPISKVLAAAEITLVATLKS